MNEQPEPEEPIDDPPELTRADFDRMLRGDQRQRIMTGRIEPGDVAALRRYGQLTPDEFAEALGISIDTLCEWEQDRCMPEGPAVALLRIAARDPRALRQNVGDMSSK